VSEVVDGVLLLDKPYGLSSNAALQHARRLLEARKAGHSGTLDPLATGLLPLCFGEATKFAQCLLDADKIYRTHIKLGITTATADAEGQVCSVKPVTASLSDIVALLPQFTGCIEQTPPMFSALKYQGKALYHYARAGIMIERPKRAAIVHSIKLLSYHDAIVELEVHCAKGVYIRSLAEAIGMALGCGAHVIRLCRQQSSSFKLADAIQLDVLAACRLTQRRQLLLPVDSLLAQYPQVILDILQGERIQRGLPIMRSELQVPLGRVRLYTEQELCSPIFIGVGELVSDGWLYPRRLLSTTNRGSLECSEVESSNSKD